MSDGERRGAGAFQISVADTSHHLRTSLLRSLPTAPLTPHLQRFITALNQLHLPLLRRSKQPARKGARSRRAVPRSRLLPPISPAATTNSMRADTLPPAPLPAIDPQAVPTCSPDRSQDSPDAGKTGDGKTRSDGNQSPASAMHGEVATMQAEGHEDGREHHGGGGEAAAAEREAAVAAGPALGRAGASGPVASAAKTVPGTPTDDAAASVPEAPAAAVMPFTGRLQPHLRSAGALVQRLSFLTAWGGARRPVRPHLRIHA